MTPLRLYQEPIPYSANSTVPKNLMRGYNFRDLSLRLTSQPTVTAANNTAANTQAGDEWGCVKKIEIQANGGELIRSFTGYELMMLNRIWYRTHRQVPTTLGDGATANPSFDTTLKIPFWALNSLRPYDTVFDAGTVNSWQIVVTWGSYTDINSAATGFTTNPNMEVLAHVQRFTTPPQFRRRLARYQQVFSGATSNARFNLETDPMYSRFFIYSQVGGVDTAGTFSQMSIVSGDTNWGQRNEPELNQSPLLSMGITSPTGDKPFVSTASNVKGQYYWDLCEDGYLTEALNTKIVGDSYLLFQVASACTITVIADQLYPIDPTTYARPSAGNTSNTAA